MVINDLKKLKKLILELKNNCPQAIPVEILSLSTMSMFVVLRESTFHRVLELIEAIHSEISCDRIIPTALLLRSLMETISLFFCTVEDLSKACDQKDFTQLNKRLKLLVSGARSKIAKEQFNKSESINVLTFIDKMDKKISNFKHQYEFLSEFCHPNSAGLNMLFSHIDKENNEIVFGDNKKINIKNFCIEASILLEFFIITYDKSLNLLDRLKQ